MSGAGEPSTTSTTSTPPSLAPPLTPPSTSPTPIPRQPVIGYGFSAVDDLSSHQLVLFGGVDSYDTTWLWSGDRWSLAHPPASPPGRFGAAAAYDPVTRVVMLFGGRLGPGDVVNDTWAWDGTTWRELDRGAGGPPPGEGSVMAWNSGVKEMVLLSGGQSGEETWLWEGDHWTRQPRGDLPFHASGLAFDPVTRTLLTVYCCPSDPGKPSTWEWSGTDWRPVSTRTQPPAVVALAFDPASGRLLVWSDPTPAGMAMLVSSWSGNDWVPRAGPRWPAFPGTQVTDIGNGHVLLLGWLSQEAQGAPQPVHVWSWNGSRWDQRA
jgi:hypothetical protein